MHSRGRQAHYLSREGIQFVAQESVHVVLVGLPRVELHEILHGQRLGELRRLGLVAVRIHLRILRMHRSRSVCFPRRPPAVARAHELASNRLLRARSFFFIN